MAAYAYATKLDRTLFAEDASSAGSGEGPTPAPPRTVGAAITCTTPDGTVLGTLTTGPAGWIDGTLPAPRAVAVTAGGRVPIYSAEWVAIRGHSMRPIVHATPDAVAPELRVRGDWTTDPTTHVRQWWTGSAWEAR